MNRVTTTLYAAIGVLVGLVLGLVVFFGLAELPQRLGGTAVSFSVLAPVSYFGIPALMVLFGVLLGIKGNKKAHAQAALWEAEDSEDINTEEDSENVSDVESAKPNVTEK